MSADPPDTFPSPFGRPAAKPAGASPLPWPTVLLALSLFSVAGMAALFYFKPPDWMLAAQAPTAVSPAPAVAPLAAKAPASAAIAPAPAEPASAALAAPAPAPVASEPPLSPIVPAATTSEAAVAPDVIPNLPSVKLKPPGSAGGAPTVQAMPPVQAVPAASASTPLAATGEPPNTDVSKCMRDGRVTFSDSGCAGAANGQAVNRSATQPQAAIILGEPVRPAASSPSAPTTQISGVPMLPTGEARQRRCQTLASELRLIEIEARQATATTRARIDADRAKAREEMTRLDC